MTTLGPEGRAIAFEKNLQAVSLRPILGDASLWLAPQDEVLFRGKILDPHGEKRRLRRVSNHDAERLRTCIRTICNSPGPEG